MQTVNKDWIENRIAGVCDLIDDEVALLNSINPTPAEVWETERNIQIYGREVENLRALLSAPAVPSTPAPTCQCGAAKTLSAPPGSPLHSKWCPDA